MLSEDNTVQVPLSDEEKEAEPKAQNVSPFPSMEPPPLLDDFDEPEETAPSKLRLDMSSTQTPSVVPSLTASSSTAPPIVSTTMSSVVSSYSSLPRSSTPPTDLSNSVLNVTIRDFEKRGDGMNAYIVYKVVTTSENVPGYTDTTNEVWRRFSDFLGLREKLVEKHQARGVVVPPAPEKSIAAMTKTKTSSESVKSEDIPRRARQLERFLRRIVGHPKMRTDCDVRDFLTYQCDLPRASGTAALSGAGVKRMFSKVSEVFNKMAFHMEEGDRWFEQALSQVEELDDSLKKVLNLAEHLASTRKDLSHAQENMSRALSMLASCEESTSLARALSHLTETEENVSALWAKQAEQDTIKFSESLAEYVGLLGSLKDVFNERVRMWQKWQDSQQLLHKKRETKSRLELTGKNDRANQLKNEIEETAKKMDQQEQEFMELSKVIREEISRFETQRRHDMRQIFVDYLKSLLQTHTEMLKLWEKFAPEAQAIIV